MIYGVVARNQVPMIFTESEEDAAFVCESLAVSLEQSYRIVDFFMEREEDEGDDQW